MKRITAFLGCVCLFLFLLCPAVSAQAAELNSFLTFHKIVTEEHQNDLLVYGTVLPENGSLTVSRTPADIENGFVLRYGGIDENCSLRALFEEKRETLQDIVNKILW